MTLWISQWKCPQNHCAIALCWDDKHTNTEEIEAQGEAIFTRQPINRWCGIDGSRNIKVEHRQSKYQTIKEAQEALIWLQLQNDLARRAIGGKY